MTLREVLHAHIPFLTPESTVRDAVDKMDIYQFPVLIIVDDQQKPLAVITEGDICRHVTTGENLVSYMSEPAFNFASKEPTTAHPDTEISDAFHKMLSSGLTVLPVVEEERVIGLVMRMDLMQAMLMDAASANISPA